MAAERKKYGKIYMLPCPISEGNPYDVLPEANRAVMARLDYFIVENVRSARRFLSAAKIGRRLRSWSLPSVANIPLWWMWSHSCAPCWRVGIAASSARQDCRVSPIRVRMWWLLHSAKALRLCHLWDHRQYLWHLWRAVRMVSRLPLAATCP